MDLGQGFDLDCTEAAVKVVTTSVSHCLLDLKRIKFFVTPLCLYLSLELTINR